MKIALLQSNYIPWKGNFDMISKVDAYVIYDEVQYTKNDWRNRNRIKTLSGDCQWLTIPVTRERLAQTIAETKVADTSWREKHWRALETNYADAPHFRAYGDAIKRLYATAPERMLSDINRHFLEGICALLGIATPISDSRSYNLQGERQERIIDLCRKLGADTYLSGPAARSYIDEALFTNAGIAIEWMDYSGYPPYPQTAGAFDHAVTILDLLLNVGPETRRYMASGS